MPYPTSLSPVTTETNPSAPSTTYNKCLMSHAKPQLIDLIITSHRNPDSYQLNAKNFASPPLNDATNQHLCKCQPPLSQVGTPRQSLAFETLLLTDTPTTRPSTSNYKDHSINHAVMMELAASKLMHVTTVTKQSSHALTYHTSSIIIRC